jgi:hypothetical protein
VTDRKDPGDGDTGGPRWPDFPDLRPSRDPDPLLPPGEYDAICNAFDFRPTFQGRQSLFLRFEIFGGPYDKANVYFIAAMPPRKQGRFVRGIALSSKFYRAWTVASGGRRPARRDRMSLEPFQNKMFRIRLRTVVMDHQRRPLAPVHQYSVVDEVLERIA